MLKRKRTEDARENIFFLGIFFCLFIFSFTETNKQQKGNLVARMKGNFMFRELELML